MYSKTCQKRYIQSSGYENWRGIMEITLELIAWGVGIIIGIITLIRYLIHYDRKYTKLESRVESLENEINDLVYQLYRLNDNDRKVIEEFLMKF